MPEGTGRTRPVDAAIAFGGVDIGRSIARDAQTATKIASAGVNFPRAGTNHFLF